MLGGQARAARSRSPSPTRLSPEVNESRLPLSPTRSPPPQPPSLHGAAHDDAMDGSEESQRSRGFWKLRPHVARFYNSFRVQMFVACLIGANFATNIIEKEIDAYGNKYHREFLVLEYFYNIAFTVELGMNMYAHCCSVFWRCGWNIFDVVVVAIGLVIMVDVPLPHLFSMLRMIRVFRVFRLFKRVRSLNKIVVALTHAVPGVVNAFLLLTIVMCIYAILAVELFIDIGKNCHEADATMAPSFRGRCFGEEYFGSFSKSLYSFFQVLTGESWSEAIARPVLWSHDDPWLSVMSAVFFVSFVLITAFVLTNVVVAVLLDKMVQGTADASELKDTGEASTPRNCVPADTALLLGVSGRLASMENHIRLLTKASAEMRSDQHEMREQLGAVLAAVRDLGCQRNRL